MDTLGAMVQAWKEGNLPAMTGVEGLINQYKSVPEQPTVAGKITQAFPLFGPSINEAAKSAAGGDWNKAGAIGTVDIGLPLLAGGAAGMIGRRLAPPLAKSAAKNYRSVLEPGKSGVVRAEEVAGQMAERKMIAGSRAGLQTQAKAGLAEYGPQTATAFSESAPVPLNKAFKAIEEVRDKHVFIKGTKIIPEYRQPLSDMIDSIHGELLKLAGDNLTIPAQIVDNFIDDLNSGLVGANQKFREQLAPKSIAQIQKSAARNLRVMLDEPNPQPAQINATYRMFKTLDDFLESSRRDRIAAQSGISKGSSKGFGALIQRLLPRPVRDIPASVAGIFDSVPWNTVSGALKQNIAESLAGGDWNKATLLMQGAAASHSLSESSEDQKKAIKNELISSSIGSKGIDLTSISGALAEEDKNRLDSFNQAMEKAPAPKTPVTIGSIVKNAKSGTALTLGAKGFEVVKGLDTGSGVMVTKRIPISSQLMAKMLGDKDQANMLMEGLSLTPAKAKKSGWTDKMLDLIDPSKASSMPA